MFFLKGDSMYSRQSAGCVWLSEWVSEKPSPCHLPPHRSVSILRHPLVHLRTSTKDQWRHQAITSVSDHVLIHIPFGARVSRTDAWRKSDGISTETRSARTDAISVFLFRACLHEIKIPSQQWVPSSAYTAKIRTRRHRSPRCTNAACVAHTSVPAFLKSDFTAPALKGKTDGLHEMTHSLFSRIESPLSTPVSKVGLS